MINKLRIRLLWSPAIFGIIILLASAVRLIGITWGLPLKKGHIDEAVVIFYSMRFLSGDLNPHVFFDYPTLFLYILALVFVCVFLAGHAAGIFSSLDQFAGTYMYGNASFLYVAARVASVFCAVASVALVILICRELSRETGPRRAPLFPAAGLAAGFLLSVNPLHVMHSHYATVDVACVFAVLLSFLFAARYFRSSEVSRLYLASFLLGLAVATKYYPVVGFPGLLLLIFVKETRPFAIAARSAVLVIAGFVTGCPYAVLDLPAFAARFADRFSMIVWKSPSGAAAVQTSHAGILFLAAKAMTIPVSVLVAGGILLLCVSGKHGRSNAVLLLFFPGAYLLFLSFWNIAAPHYILPAMPFLMMAGCQGLFSHPWGAGKQYLASLLVLLAALGPFADTVRTDAALTREDTRLTAYHWIQGAIPEKSRILRFAYTPEFSASDPFSVTVDWENKRSGTEPAELARQYDYLIMSQFNNNPPGPWETRLLSSFTMLKAWGPQTMPLGGFHHPKVILYERKN